MFWLKFGLYGNIVAGILNIAAIVRGSPMILFNIICIFVSTGMVMLMWRTIREQKALEMWPRKGKYDV